MPSNTIVVLGMHRSGTSAVSGVLSKLDVFMGSTLYKAQKGVNEKGFFENSKIVELNERLFDKLYSSWDNPLAAKTIFEMRELQKEVLEAKALIKAEYSSKKYWGIKDPRSSILMPFWKKVFSELGIQPFYLVMVRSPLEVHESLKKRDNFSLEKSLTLWTHYTLASLRQIGKNNHHIIQYDDLMTSPQETLEELLDKFAPELKYKTQEASQFISPSLRNHQALNWNAGNSDKIFDISERLYEYTKNEIKESEILTDLNEEFYKYIESLGGVVSEHLEKIKSDEVHFRNLFNQAYYSMWWKISWPIRVLEKKLYRRN